jgi:hypothetical protein
MKGRKRKFLLVMDLKKKPSEVMKVIFLPPKPKRHFKNEKNSFRNSSLSTTPEIYQLVFLTSLHQMAKE